VGVAGRVLMDGDECGHPGVLGVGAADEVARTLGRHHEHVDAFRSGDGTEVDVEPVGEHEGIAGVEVGGDLLVVDVSHVLVGHQHHHHVRPPGGLRRRHHRETCRFGFRPARRPFAQTYGDIDTRVLEVVGMGMALGAVADDGDALAFDDRRIGLVVVVDGCWHRSHSFLFAQFTARRRPCGLPFRSRARAIRPDFTRSTTP
jgi:hypothetical protein